MYADLPGFISPSVITGDNLRPDLLLTYKNTCVYTLELTVGFETNLSINAARKTNNYQDLTVDLRQQYNDVKLISLSISTLGIISSLSNCFYRNAQRDQGCKYSSRIYIERDICHYNQIYLFHLLQTRKGLEYSGTIDLLIHFFFQINFSFATRVANYKLPIFSEVYDCIVEFQYTYMKVEKNYRWH